jgi:hypothetical protein
MKNRIILLIAFLGLQQISVAQEAQQSGLANFINKYRIGLFGSIGSSNLNPTSSSSGGSYNYNISKVKGRMSFGFGLSAEKTIDKRYAIYTGLGLDWIGGTLLATTPKFTVADSNEYARLANMTYRLQYINAPIGLKLKATSIDKFTIYGLVGLNLGVPIGRKADYVITKYDATNLNIQSEKLSFSTITPVSVAYQIGAGTEFKVSADNAAYLSIIYTNGFIDHTNPKAIDKPNAKFSDGVVRSNNLCARLGFFF